MICEPRCHSDDKMKNSENTRAFGTLEERRDAHRDFVRENWGKETIWKT